MSECIEWSGLRDRDGYGQLSVKGRTVKAHRLAYELAIGPIPEGLVLDHLCRNRGCVNPDHLEPVTHRENILRGEGLAAVNAAKDRCDHGHPFDERNTIIERKADGRTFRRCRACKLATSRAYHARKSRAPAA